MLELLFDEYQITKHTNFEYDAKINDTHILSHLDSDLCRLNRFREAIISLGNTTEKYEVLCFEWQYDFVKKFLGDLAKVTVIRFDEVDKELSEYYSRYLIKYPPAPAVRLILKTRISPILTLKSKRV